MAYIEQDTELQRDMQRARDQRLARETEAREQMDSQYNKTVRDVFANMAMGAILRLGSDDYEKISDSAYKMADAMMKRRSV